MKHSRLILFCIFLQALGSPLSAGNKNMHQTSGTSQIKLLGAVTCEAVKNHAPKNQAVVFSVSIRKVYCLTSFGDIPEMTFVYHNWFHIDKLSAKRKLRLNPPNWSVLSSIQLRETDKGPWKVEITDQQGNILSILRFSITD